jgi:hypothetical protein
MFPPPPAGKMARRPAETAAGQRFRASFTTGVGALVRIAANVDGQEESL